ncbi:hypothetical protein KDW_31070 [Dictyobacter vulcani]|uniref:Uncharacterized protein n=1 Tax=Dictyobacter vulcani TaxID=2607529 RepID=A0A5J4KM52_9CHLR|nr:hypothetical protein [Dictyobacter vulcani]GER88945.1 hypothetical protein KDW_31070 [Dictyobacter vulcani]
MSILACFSPIAVRFLCYPFTFLDYTLDYDNMQNRPIQGTADWQRYQVVLDVPGESLDIAFGLLLQGKGQVWLQDASIIEVGNEIDVTSLKETNNFES